MLITHDRRLGSMSRHPSARGHESQSRSHKRNFAPRRAAALLVGGATALLAPVGIEAAGQLVRETPGAKADKIYEKLTDGKIRPISLSIDARDIDFDSGTPGSIVAAVGRARELNKNGDLADPTAGNIHVLNTQVANALFHRINTESNGPIQGQSVIVGYQDIETQSK